MLIRRSSDAPLSEQLYDGLRHAVRSGRLPPGARVPASRALATTEGVARNTVLAVYARLLEEGYLVSRARGGTFVAPGLPDTGFGLPAGAGAGSSPRSTRVRLSRRGRRLATMHPSWTSSTDPLRWDFRYGRPAPDAALRRTWRRCVTDALRTASATDFGYGPPEGAIELREAIADHLERSRAVACRPDQVLVVHGSQQALQLTADVLIDPGDGVILEEPGYAGAASCFRAAGARLVPLTVGPEGLDLRLPDSRARGARLAYVTPSHQFPTGVVMTLARRLDLLAWAARSGGWIFEDDYDSEFRFGARPIESLQGLDPHGRVLYAGSFSKVLFPALRLGYLVVPEELLPPFVAAKALADTGNGGLEQRALARLLRSGAYARHLRRVRAEHAARRAALLEAIHRQLGPRVEVRGANAGVHVMLHLLDVPVSEEERLVRRAADAGVGVYSPASFFCMPHRRRHAALLLGYASLDPTAIARGIARLAAVLVRRRTCA